MPAPSLNQIFGANVQLLTADANIAASAADPVLCIRFSDFSSTGLDQSANAPSAQAWYFALTKKFAAFSASNSDEVPNIVVEAPTADSFLGVSPRNGMQKVSIPFSMTIYIPFAGTSDPDPDTIA